MVKKYFRADLFSRTPSLRAVFGTNFRAISRNFHLLREIARKLVRAKISTIKVVRLARWALHTVALYGTLHDLLFVATKFIDKPNIQGYLNTYSNT